MSGHCIRYGTGATAADAPQPQRWTSAEELRVLWFIQTYRDLHRLRPSLARLRTVYPDAPVLVVSDGDPDPEVERVCRACAAEFRLGSRMFGVDLGGEPVQRMLDVFLEADADILIKIDPDTDVRRRFSLMPPPMSPSIYGTVQTAGSQHNRLVSIQGGCIVVPRKAASILARSGLLRSERLKPPALEWAVDSVLLTRVESGLTSYDHTLGWACRELGLHCKAHPEVFSRYRPNIIDTLIDHGAAVSHPRFELRQLADPVFYRPRRLADRKFWALSSWRSGSMHKMADERE
jgi:hypothetical protein